MARMLGLRRFRWPKRGSLGLWCWLTLAGLGLGSWPTPGSAVQPPTWLPRYQFAVRIDVEANTIAVRQDVIWLNRHRHATDELVFNVHSHFQPLQKPLDAIKLSKMLEIMRIPAHEALFRHSPFQLHKVWLLSEQEPTQIERELPHAWQPDIPTALRIRLPRPIGLGELVRVRLEYEFRPPAKQGRWGQWKGVTFLTNWSPVLAVFDETGWHPTPFVPWHQPFYNEAGIYQARVILPSEQHLACGATIGRIRLLQAGWKEVELLATPLRDFPLLCSARYREFSREFGPVRIRCFAFAEHEHYAKRILAYAGRAVVTYAKWFGPYPYRDLTFAESFFGWNGNECAGLVMIDERVFGMPHLLEGYIEYLISHETCHQWWYNVIGTDGYRETFMDEAFATYFAHRLLNLVEGRNNAFIRYPKQLSWLPQIEREDYRYSQFYSTVGRGELLPPIGEMEKYRHVVNLFSAAYDRGSKILGMIEDRLGESAFLEFMREIYRRRAFQIYRVADFQQDLERFTGRSWSDFFQHWLREAGLTDWAIEKVHIENVDGTAVSETSDLVRVVVELRQKAEYSEPTTIGFSFDGEAYPLRLPIQPRGGPIVLGDVAAQLERYADGSYRVETLLPRPPVQVSVDPDQILADRDPANNHWKPKFRIRATPVYTFLDETPLTTAYDRWNLTLGPWFYAPSYADPWYTRASIVGPRAGVYRTEQGMGGIYAGYRPDFRDIAAGFDWEWQNAPFAKVDTGLHAEKSLFQLAPGGSDLDRAVVYSRYIITPSAGMYTPPTHHVELFASWQRNFLPQVRCVLPQARCFEALTSVGVHYHLDLLTPYWNPELGFRLDVSYAAGFAILGQPENSHQLSGQFAWVWTPGDWAGRLSLTTFAFRTYAGLATPRNTLFFSLGGNQLLRGFDMAERQGNSVWIVSAEWRLPLLADARWDVLDHVIGLRGVYLAPFYDVGAAYLDGQLVNDVAHALGVGLRADLAWFSFIERTTLRFDLAKTWNAATPWQFWFGIQHPF